MKQDVGQLISVASQIFNAVGIDKASFSFEYGASGLRLRIEFRDVVLRKGRFEGLAFDEGLFYIENLDVNLPPKEMLSKAVVRVERLLLRVSAGLLNEIVSSAPVRNELRRSVPQIEISELACAFAGERVIIRGQVKKGLTFSFAVDLFLQAVNNNLRVVFENFWSFEMVPLPGFVRNMLMKVLRNVIASKQSLRGFVAATDEYITVNPWPKIPIKVIGEFTRFGVEGHYLLIEMGPKSGNGLAAAEPSQVAERKSEPVASQAYAEKAEVGAEAAAAASAPAVEPSSETSSLSEGAMLPLPVLPVAQPNE